ncbi:hypothetical protein PUNSTDRAFT_72337 [Punctularia strigosozonata HHB-11173 SS5]|uniref:uncharacterized protein n=1 Tax=Punctularia strigosozonata (strain HHB-11173) TaxID=741275 RepID=UPI000441697F|nr:uncharacterized protein PUNSTDRAFT_72337 [Punctularia strigosozonata HHB-11173 SS5]EIN06509.1 hypothetical protein PUNSTDRAFT_72337 [Punctularia strigosozonata HHB-11173 SS5]
MTSEELDYTDVDVDLDAAIPPRDPVSRVDGISDISSELTVSEITTSENLHASSVVTTSNSSHYPPEFVRTYPDGDREVLIQFDVSRVSKRWSTLRSPYARDIDCQPTTAIANEASADLSTSGGLKNADDNEKAADALARVITKSDFETMDVLGQFNLGFIITRRRQWQTNDHEADVENKPFSDDLFIIDQHAADEKYNFETLQQTTKIQSQRLFRPRPLELTAADELVVTENIEVLRQNGFDVAVDENASFGQGRLQLVAQPVSKNTVFDMKDLEELLHLMQDRPTGRMVRCSKAQAMFASRACRKSVMIGDPLTRKQMRSVVRHMGTMDQPWNCPHGRPTMRHLSDLRALEEKHANAVNRTIDWQAFE